ncbi:MHYT domain-containing protein, partial [Chlamydiota bacterium]
MDFFQTGPIPQDVITGSYYNYGLVALSYFIATLASYVALEMAGRVRTVENRRSKFFWLIGGAFAMGAGIWSMHFIGMLAFVMPMPMDYEMSWTLSSLFIAMIASWFALYLLRKEGRPLRYMVAGGVLLGLGIASMHYVGMAGMTGIHITYMPGLFFISIAVAIGASEAALWLALKSNRGTFRKQLYYKFASAFIMGAAICGMHYIGMAAAIFHPLPEMGSKVSAIPAYALAFYIAGVTAIIIGVALVASTYKQLLINATKTEKDFLDAILNNLVDGIVACNSKGKITVCNLALQKMIDLPKGLDILQEWNNYFRFYRPDKSAPLLPQDNPLRRALAGEQITSAECIVLTHDNQERYVLIDGQPIVNEHQEKVGAVIVIHDVTKQKEMEQQLIRQATHDVLTDLPNRSLLVDRI